MVSIDDVEEIIDTDIVGGQIVERLLYVDPASQEKITKQEDITFYKKQRRVALHGCGVINPEDIDEAIGMGAFQGLKKALSMTQQEVIDEVLAGRYQADRALYPDIHCLLGTVRGTVPHTSPGRHAGAHVSRLGVHNHHRLSCRRDNGCGKALLERDNDKGHHHDVRYILLPTLSPLPMPNDLK